MFRDGALLATFTLAKSIPLVLVVWGLAYQVMLRRKALYASWTAIGAHFILLVAIATITSQATNSAELGVDFLVVLIASVLSCSILRIGAKVKPPAPAALHDTSRAYHAGSRFAEYFRLLGTRNLVLAVLAAATLFYWLGYPWTYQQCLSWASQKPTERGVAVAMQVCSRMERSSGQ